MLSNQLAHHTASSAGKFWVVPPTRDPDGTNSSVFWTGTIFTTPQPKNAKLSETQPNTAATASVYAAQSPQALPVRPSCKISSPCVAWHGTKQRGTTQCPRRVWHAKEENRAPPPPAQLSTLLAHLIFSPIGCWVLRSCFFHVAPSQPCVAHYPDVVIMRFSDEWAGAKAHASKTQDCREVFRTNLELHSPNGS